MLKITKSFSASENGIDIVKYQKDSLHKELPAVALAYGHHINAIAAEKSQDELAAEAAAKVEAEAVAKVEAADDKKAKAADKKAAKAAEQQE
jgi:hypothetical protein